MQLLCESSWLAAGSCHVSEAIPLLLPLVGFIPSHPAVCFPSPIFEQDLTSTPNMITAEFTPDIQQSSTYRKAGSFLLKVSCYSSLSIAGGEQATQGLPKNGIPQGQHKATFGSWEEAAVSRFC